MPTVLITGANRGLGLEFARQYVADGWRVIATCREEKAAPGLADIDGDIGVHQLDITDHASIQALAKSLRKEPIDLLLNNAGVYGPRPVKLGGVDYAAWDDVMHVNTMSPLKVTECFLENVAASDLKKIISITSKMGSIADNEAGGSYIYRSSKAALNAVMKSLSVDLSPRGISVAMLHPGWVRTDMGGPSGLIDAEESVSGMRRVIDGLTLETSGRMLNYDGAEIPW
ncbi:MAG: SDR family oxidoreductase [Rhodospirillaceae bacterium]|jgi:NAD(P)-dependent dehydrogenase (short-subunit alcohol dehydrogenase family)|nr:SDR family oxidoreductase [Rhodospirillaceae bacterium]MBT4218558.1 SDR family oxidoreductase [Rhodospirillaceae bacterium]MBT4464773.1 SDR family oxidoreductase [Rhodospirillaceae bacterium]MBT5309049.1 SDR family oxidoreductase [Rhodospirillaceae bacterium]MBT7356189.1 SDR family oxidoreductase [Rhodospirillaceae bacterium]